MNTSVPCALVDPELFFAEQPTYLHAARALCAGCPARAECLAGALRRAEPWGVWGGEIIVDGAIVANKRGRGRPRKDSTNDPYAGLSPAVGNS